MPIYDYECNLCGFTQEVVTHVSDDVFSCPMDGCPGAFERLFSAGAANTMPFDADWIATVREVVNKNPKNQLPIDREFMLHPTRGNYQKWMKAHGLRHLEDGEGEDKTPKTDWDAWKSEAKDELNKRFQWRNSIDMDVERAGSDDRETV